MNDHIEKIVNDILARKMREQLMGKENEKENTAPQGNKYLPKPPPPKLWAGNNHTDTIQQWEEDEPQPMEEEWDWPDPQQKEVYDSEEGHQPQPEMSEVQGEDSHAHTPWDEAPPHNEPGNNEAGDEAPNQEETADPQGDEQMEQKWEEPDQEEQETPVRAPQIVPTKGVKTKKRPQFVPLNVGGYAKVVTVGHATPLTHPTPPPATMDSFMHPIDDPRLRSFFKKMGKEGSSWEPPTPPCIQPKTSIGGDEQTTTMPKKMANVPVQSKACPPKRPRRAGPPKKTGYRTKWQLPEKDEGIEPSEEQGDDDLQDKTCVKARYPKRFTKQHMTRYTGAKRRKVWIQLRNGRRVQAHYWIP